MAKKPSPNKGYSRTAVKRAQNLWASSKPTPWAKHKIIKNTNIPPIEQWLKERITSLTLSDRTKKWVSVAKTIGIWTNTLFQRNPIKTNTVKETKIDAMWKERIVTIDSYEDTISLITDEWNHIDFIPDNTSVLVSHSSNIAYLANQRGIKDKRVLSLEVEIEWHPNDMPWYPVRKYIEKAAS